MTATIEKLKKIIDSKGAYLFIGAGVSIWTTNDRHGCASWTGLLQNGLRELEKIELLASRERSILLERLNNPTDPDSLLEIASMIKSKFNLLQKDLFKLWLAESLGGLEAKKPELIEAIGQLDCPIFTTNYDPLLCKILNRKPLTLKQYQNEGIAGNGTNTYEALKEYVVYIHGYYDDPDSIILTREDYLDILGRDFDQVYLKSRILEHTLIFIGYGNGLNDLNFTNLLTWITKKAQNAALPCYKVELEDEKEERMAWNALNGRTDNIESVIYGQAREYQKLYTFIQSLRPTKTDTGVIAGDYKDIKAAYLRTLIGNYGKVSISGYSDIETKLPIEDVYVDLKFDPAHPSIRTLKTQTLIREFNRKLYSDNFFSQQEIHKLHIAISRHNPGDYFRRDWNERYINMLLDDNLIFSIEDRNSIRKKIQELKEKVFHSKDEQGPSVEKKISISETYSRYKHFIILGHPGSGKTTLSQWMTINMAKQNLDIGNDLFTEEFAGKYAPKIPILIPVWKYVEKLKSSESNQRLSMLQFIVEHAISKQLPSSDPHLVESSDRVIKNALIAGKALIILEGLDEIPLFEDRTFLISQINLLLERRIYFDPITDEISYYSADLHEIEISERPDAGNRVIITSRIEGNYFAEINPVVPRLTVDELSPEALEKFCCSYMVAIDAAERRQRGIASKGELQERAISEENGQKLFAAIKDSSIYHLAINPQLASIIASIYEPEGEGLPKKRIKLYETAIKKMISKLRSLTPHLRVEYALNEEEIWFIFQSIAENLHNRSESLHSEDLERIILNSLIICWNETKNKPSMRARNSARKLLGVFKSHSGMITEYGANSYRFIHRTFQEYLAGKGLIASAEIDPVEKIREKLTIPNWRLPISMALGMLSESRPDEFALLLEQLLDRKNGSISISHFIIVDSLPDMDFDGSDEETKNKIIRLLLQKLFDDYKNIKGYSKLKDHQRLVESYIVKLKEFRYNDADHVFFVRDWLIDSMKEQTNIAPVANILYQTKWYDESFYEILLLNLHNDDRFWNWPVDSVLRWYSSQDQETALQRLSFRRLLSDNPDLIVKIKTDQDWLRLIIALYGGYKNYDTPLLNVEYSEIVSYLQLADMEREPFALYYREVWGEDPVYQMAVMLDTTAKYKKTRIAPIFEADDIYKTSVFTEKIYQYLMSNKPAMALSGFFMEIVNGTDDVSIKAEALLGLVSLGNLGEIEYLPGKHPGLESLFENRCGQLINGLKDPVARCTRSIENLLTLIYKNGAIDLDIPFAYYCKTFLSIVMHAGAYPANIQALFGIVEDPDDKNYLMAEYIASLLTTPTDDHVYSIAVFLDTTFKKLFSPEQWNNALLRISDCVQIHKPVRSYPLPLDTFVFHGDAQADIPIAVIDLLEQLHPKIRFLEIAAFTDIYLKRGLFSAHPQLTVLALLSIFSSIGDSTERNDIYEKLSPDFSHSPDKKKQLLSMVDRIESPYFQSRALCQLGEYYYERTAQLLSRAYEVARNISDPAMQFQVCEKIYSATFYKEEMHGLREEVYRHLTSLPDKINDGYNCVIALIRLSFPEAGDHRKAMLGQALQQIRLLPDINERAGLLMKIGPLAALYPDLYDIVRDDISSIDNTSLKSFVTGNFGSLLASGKLDVSQLKEEAGDPGQAKPASYEDMYALVTLYSLVSQTGAPYDNDIIAGKWLALYRNPNEANVTALLQLAINEEFILTPSIALIIDELISHGYQKKIEILFPYLIRPANEVLPVVFKWFTTGMGRLKETAALLLTESKFVFKTGLNDIIGLLDSHHDQLRYRAIRVIQNPERDPKAPEKRISVIGKETAHAILKKKSLNHSKSRAKQPLSYFLFDLLWDEPSMIDLLLESPEHTSKFNGIFFIDDITWKRILQLLEEGSFSEVELRELTRSVFQILRKTNLVEEGQWKNFTRILTSRESAWLSTELYFTVSSIDLMRHILHASTTAALDLKKEVLPETVEAGIIKDTTVNIMQMLTWDKGLLTSVLGFNFTVPTDYQQEIGKLLEEVLIDESTFSILLEWLYYRLKNSLAEDKAYLLMLTEVLICLLGGLATRDDYRYRKITGQWGQDKVKAYQDYLINVIEFHPYFPARGAAFVLLATLDKPGHTIIIRALDILLDEYLVNAFAVGSIPSIHLNSTAYVDDLLKLLNDESAVKVYSALKILTQYVQTNENLDLTVKSKISQALLAGVEKLESRKQATYYYTDVKIPPTITLEEAFYNAWIKIQGLSGKING